MQTIDGKSVLYVELKKALYGTMQAALLFWKLLTSKLIAIMGFEINPYDWCVANKTIDGKQCTILWHVNNLKISHGNPKVVTSVIKQLVLEFGKEAPLTITRGKTHDYLGMTLGYSIDSKVQIKMNDYIDNMISNLPADMDGELATPALNHLFEVNTEDTQVMLDKVQADMFHHKITMWPNSFSCANEPGPIYKRQLHFCVQEIGPCHEVLARYSKHAACTRGRQYERDEVVGRCVLCRPSGHEKSYWRSYVTGKRSCARDLNVPKDQHHELH
jgi:hypothetical protein